MTTTIMDLQRDLQFARGDTQIWKWRCEELKAQVKDFFAAVKKAPERVMTFISKVLHKNHLCFSAQETEKYFENQEVSCEQG